LLRVGGTLSEAKELTMKTGIVIGLLGAAMCLSGCGKTITMVYHSNPEGALVYEGDTLQGRTPITLKYEAPPAFNSGGCTTFRTMTAVWPSGARVIAPDVTACKSNTYLQNFVFQRPTDVPGLDADAQIAAAQEMAQAAQAQADAATADANAWMIGNALGNAAGAAFVQPTPAPAYPAAPSSVPETVTCTTHPNGDFAGTVTTTCH
jgi:hypothetical protein